MKYCSSPGRRLGRRAVCSIGLGQGGCRSKSCRNFSGRSIRWRDAVSYFKVKESLRRFRPDVVRTHSAKGGILGRAAAWSLGVPAVVHTVHGARFYPEQGRAGRSGSTKPANAGLRDAATPW